MPNDAITLLQFRMRQRGVAGSISPQAMILCEIIDEKTNQWLYDRDRHLERIKALEEEIRRMKTQGAGE